MTTPAPANIFCPVAVIATGTDGTFYKLYSGTSTANPTPPPANPFFPLAVVAVNTSGTAYKP